MLAIVLTLYGCQDVPAELTEQKKNAIVTEIKERLAGYHEAVKRKDVEWFREFWANEKEFAAALDGDLSTDYQSWFEKNYVEALPGIKEVLYLKFADGKAGIVNEDAVTYATSFDWGMITTTNDTIQSKGSIIYVFRRKDGIWKCIQTAGTHKYY